MVLKFKSIDLEALQNLHLASRQEILEDLQQQVNGLLLGEVAQSFNLTWIKQVNKAKLLPEQLRHDMCSL